MTIDRITKLLDAATALDRLAAINEEGAHGYWGGQFPDLKQKWANKARMQRRGAARLRAAARRGALQLAEELGRE